MSHHVVLGEVRTYYERVGSGGPLVLLHPGGVDSRVSRGGREHRHSAPVPSIEIASGGPARRGRRPEQRPGTGPTKRAGRAGIGELRRNPPTFAVGLPRRGFRLRDTAGSASEKGHHVRHSR